MRSPAHPSWVHLVQVMSVQRGVVYPLNEHDSTDDDGTTETETEGVVVCPHCGEVNAIALDPSGGSTQEYVEDCQVCCRPWRLTVHYGTDGSAEVLADPLSE